jgi:hypothetical protein
VDTEVIVYNDHAHRLRYEVTPVRARTHARAHMLSLADSSPIVSCVRLTKDNYEETLRARRANAGTSFDRSGHLSYLSSSISGSSRTLVHGPTLLLVMTCTQTGPFVRSGLFWKTRPTDSKTS